MKCYNCGNEIPEGSLYCLNCGRKKGDCGNNLSDTQLHGTPEHRKANNTSTVRVPLFLRIIFAVMAFFIFAIAIISFFFNS